MRGIHSANFGTGLYAAFLGVRCNNGWVVSLYHRQSDIARPLVTSKVCLHRRCIIFVIADGHTVSNAPDLF